MRKREPSAAGTCDWGPEAGRGGEEQERYWLGERSKRWTSFPLGGYSEMSPGRCTVLTCAGTADTSYRWRENGREDGFSEIPDIE
jgi:hypothetical protein